MRLTARPVLFGILLTGSLIPAGNVSAAEARLGSTGTIAGIVSSTSGFGQVGATVLLLNRYDRPVMRTLTNERGQFGFEALLPDIYSVKVLLSSFVPALKGNIQVLPGRSSFLNIQLAGLMSSIELFQNASGSAKLMSEDWKWVLRSSVSTRPVLRFLPGYDISKPGDRKSETHMFSDTRGLVKVSAGDSAGTAAYANQQDLGTAFAMATSLFGSNQVGVSGNVGFNPATGTPSAGFRTSFRRGKETTSLATASPEVNLTVRQLFLPGRAGAGLLQSGMQSGIQTSGAPALRSLSLTVGERKQVTDNLLLEYGFSLDSITFVERLNYASPYARASYELDDLGVIEFGFNSGAPPIELLARRGDGSNADLQQHVNALGMFPRVSLADGRAHVQRAENYEIGYRRVVGDTTVSVAMYRESIRNGALTVAGAGGIISQANLLPDLTSNSSVFNVGAFRRTGFIASATQNFGDNFSATLSLGRGGVLRTEQREILTGEAADLRGMIHRAQQNFAAIQVKGTVPVVGTRLASSYQWTDYRSLTPGHYYLTQRTYPEAGLNLSIRQPMPLMRGVPGRMEMTAEARNMLAQGYLPLSTPEGRRMLLIHTPRALRGGVSFIF